MVVGVRRSARSPPSGSPTRSAPSGPGWSRSAASCAAGSSPRRTSRARPADSARLSRWNASGTKGTGRGDGTPRGRLIHKRSLLFRCALSGSSARAGPRRDLQCLMARESRAGPSPVPAGSHQQRIHGRLPGPLLAALLVAAAALMDKVCQENGSTGLNVMTWMAHPYHRQVQGWPSDIDCRRRRPPRPASRSGRRTSSGANGQIEYLLREAVRARRRGRSRGAPDGAVEP